MATFKSLLLAFIFLFLIAANSWAQSDEGAEFLFSTNKSPIPAGETAYIEVNLDSGDSRIIAVDLRLRYPSEKISIVNLDMESSNFEIEADEKIEDGEIAIVRGTTDPKSGFSKVARLQIRAIEDFDLSELSYSPQSIAMNSENKNVLIGSQVVTKEAVELEEVPNDSTGSFWDKIKDLNIIFWDWLFGLLNSFTGK